MPEPMDLKALFQNDREPEQSRAFVELGERKRKTANWRRRAAWTGLVLVGVMLIALIQSPALALVAGLNESLQGSAERLWQITSERFPAFGIGGFDLPWSYLLQALAILIAVIFAASRRGSQ